MSEWYSIFIAFCDLEWCCQAPERLTLSRCLKCYLMKCFLKHSFKVFLIPPSNAKNEMEEMVLEGLLWKLQVILCTLTLTFLYRTSDWVSILSSAPKNCRDLAQISCLNRTVVIILVIWQQNSLVYKSHIAFVSYWIWWQQADCISL